MKVKCFRLQIGFFIKATDVATFLLLLAFYRGEFDVISHAGQCNHIRNLTFSRIHRHIDLLSSDGSNIANIRHRLFVDGKIFQQSRTKF